VKTVIGLGSIGCRVVDKFAVYPQYKTYKIDVDIEDGLAVKEQPTPEAYEEAAPNVKKYLKGVKGELLFVLCGANLVTAAALRILENLQRCGISILYIKPDADDLDKVQKLHERVTFHVLQEYARSGVFECMYIVDNAVLDEVVQDVPIRQYRDKINEVVASTFHMINVFENTESEFSTFSKKSQTSRVATFGIVDQDGGEKLFFSLDSAHEKYYYYAIPEGKMEDEKLMKKIKKDVKSRSDSCARSYYSIFSTTYDDEYRYCLAYSQDVQVFEEKA